MEIGFEKWHGCKNDFVITSLVEDKVVLDSLKRQAARICRRSGEGIGADGIIVLLQTNSRELIPSRLLIINADGSMAKTCGNGIRCAALSVLRRLRNDPSPDEIPESLHFMIEDQEVSCRFLSKKQLKKTDTYWPLVAVDMGVPRLNEEAAAFPSVKEEVRRILASIDMQEMGNDFSYCEMPNPHLAFFTERFDRATLNALGSAMQKSTVWDGINVHLVRAAAPSAKDIKEAKEQLGKEVEDLFEALVWERGVGPTQACGSGACAIAVTSLTSGFVNRDQWVAVEMPGGRLFVRQKEPDDVVTLAGPGELVFTGRIEI